MDFKETSQMNALEGYGLTSTETEMINTLLVKYGVKSSCTNLTLEQLRLILDGEWSSMGCSNTFYDEDLYSKYYASAAWLINGIFIESDQESMKQRESVKQYISSLDCSRILDYGGGFGTLGYLLSGITCRDVNVDIYEPYPTRYMLNKANQRNNLNVISEICGRQYEAIVCMDVLEHLFDQSKPFVN